MAGAMRKMAVYLGLVEDEDEQYYDDGYDSYDAPHDVPTSGRSTAVRRYSAVEDTHDAANGRPRSPQSVPPLEDRSRDAEPDHVRELGRITTLHPRSYNDARTIGEHFRVGTPVIMNLTDMDDTDAKRLVDFSAGLIFGLRGSIERVTSKVFLLSPQNVQVTAEAKERIAEGGFFNQS